MTVDLGRGVIVLGMHRSGTSAVTGVIDAMGLPACRAEDRFPVYSANPRGNFESRSVSMFDESLLRALGGRWWAPVLPPEGWLDVPEVASSRAEAAGLFKAAYPSARWAWKDPRACVLLPYWDLVLGAANPRIVVLRHPMEIAASLATRDRMPTDQALAITERSVRECLARSAGRPVLITRYADLLEDPSKWCETCASFLSENGIDLPRPLRLEQVRAFIDEPLRHHREEAEPHFQGGVWEWACERVGVHPTLSTAGLPPESPRTETVLRAALSGGPSQSLNR